MEFSLLWAALAGVATMGLALRWRRPHLPPHAFDRLMGAVLVGLASGRLAAMAVAGVNPITRPGDLLVVRGGVDTGFASAGALLALAWWFRRDLFRSLDALAPPILFGLAGWQAGCLFRQACLGTASDLPWAWSRPGSQVTRHPVELYAALLLGAGGLWLWGRQVPAGTLAGAALVVAAGARWVTQPLRPSLAGGPVVWYGLAVLVGTVVALVGWRRARPP